MENQILKIKIKIHNHQINYHLQNYYFSIYMNDDLNLMIHLYYMMLLYIQLMNFHTILIYLVNLLINYPYFHLFQFIIYQNILKLLF